MLFFTSKFPGRSIPPPKIPRCPNQPLGRAMLRKSPSIIQIAKRPNDSNDTQHEGHWQHLGGPKTPATKPRSRLNFTIHSKRPGQFRMGPRTLENVHLEACRNLGVSGGNNNNNNNKLHASQSCAMVEITLDSPNFTKPTAPTWSHRGITRQWWHLL